MPESCLDSSFVVGDTVSVPIETTRRSRNADHEQRPRHDTRAGRLVHRHGLPRHRRGAGRPVEGECEQRPFHARRARTAWHTHPNGQTIFVLEGIGLCQRRGGAVEVIRPGDRVFFEPGEEHWHGAAGSRFMTHLALQQVDDEGNTATWGEHVTDEEYGAAPG